MDPEPYFSKRKVRQQFTDSTIYTIHNFRAISERHGMSRLSESNKGEKNRFHGENDDVGMVKGDKLGAVSVTKHSLFWLERFQFVSAVKINTQATSLNVLPFKDLEGLSKYVGVGDDLGNVYVFTRSGDVMVQFDTMTGSLLLSRTGCILSYLSRDFLETEKCCGDPSDMLQCVDPLLTHKTYGIIVSDLRMFGERVEYLMCLKRLWFAMIMSFSAVSTLQQSAPPHAFLKQHSTMPRESVWFNSTGGVRGGLQVAYYIYGDLSRSEALRLQWREGYTHVLFYSLDLSEFFASFLDYHAMRRLNGNKNEVIPLIASDHEKLVILSLGSGYIGMYRSNLPITKGEFNTMLWSTPVLFFILFLFVAWHFFANKKEALTSWGPDDPFPNGAPSSTGERSFGDPTSRNHDIMDLRGGGASGGNNGSGIRGPTRRYGSPTRFTGPGANSFRPTSMETVSTAP
ncbi:hypothetical protein Tco_0026681 [Tanacetum coccineum]